MSKAVFISGVPPFLLKTPDNPEGVNGSVCEGIRKAIVHAEKVNGDPLEFLGKEKGDPKQRGHVR